MNPQTIPTIPLFSSVKRRERNTLARLADVVDVAADTTLTRQGDHAGELFVILDGVALASRDGEPVALLGPGDFFGEIGLLDGPWRTATVSAETPMELVVVGSREFWTMLDTFPAIREQIESAAAARSEGGAHRLAA